MCKILSQCIVYAILQSKCKLIQKNTKQYKRADSITELRIHNNTKNILHENMSVQKNITKQCFNLFRNISSICIVKAIIIRSHIVKINTSESRESNKRNSRSLVLILVSCTLHSECTGSC